MGHYCVFTFFGGNSQPRDQQYWPHTVPAAIEHLTRIDFQTVNPITKVLFPLCGPVLELVRVIK